VLVALDGAGVPLNLPLLLAACALAAVAGFLLVTWAGDRYLAAANRVDQTYISVGVLALLCVLVAALAGLVGVGIFAVSTLIGLVPARFGARRVTLMGVLLVPLAVAL
jgi:putative membrane protein